jgi:hypothetical protein
MRSLGGATGSGGGGIKTEYSTLQTAGTFEKLSLPQEVK